VAFEEPESKIATPEGREERRKGGREGGREEGGEHYKAQN
jgi:hypothetical protein